MMYVVKSLIIGTVLGGVKVLGENALGVSLPAFWWKRFLYNALIIFIVLTWTESKRWRMNDLFRTSLKEGNSK